MSTSINIHHIFPPSLPLLRALMSAARGSAKLYKLDINHALSLSPYLDKLIKSHKVILADAEVHLSLHSFVLVDTKHKFVHRISLSPYGKNHLTNNIQFLHANASDCFPKVVLHDENDNKHMWTTETLLVGDNIKPSTVNHKNIKDLAKPLIALYKKSSREVKAPFKKYQSYLTNQIRMSNDPDKHKLIAIIDGLASNQNHSFLSGVFAQIHGDLTHENMTFKNSQFKVFDFERTHSGFVEFDAWLLTAFAKIRQQKLHHYADMYQYLINHQPEIINASSLKYITKQLPLIKVNQKHHADIYQWFLAYIGILTYIGLEIKDKGRTRFLTQISRTLAQTT